MSPEIILALAAGPLVLAAHTYETLRKSRQRPHRDAWNTEYGAYLDSVGTVWFDRDCQQADRQRKLDASQNVMTRLL